MSYFGIPIRNGLPIGLGSVAPLASGGGSPFSPLSLFSGGTPGAWYDPSDFTTLFQDSAGTTPVTAVEQPVGLMLDKSQGLVLGSELVTNGDFSNGFTGWAAQSAWSIVDGKSVLQDGVTTNTQLARFDYGQVSGKLVEIRFDLTILSGTLVLRPNYASTTNQQALTTSGTKVLRLVVAANSFEFFASSACTGVTLDNVSVKIVPGNHAFQATSASRPVLSARYNLLTKTEQFDDAAWVTSGRATITPNDAIAPDGTLTADRIVETVDNGTHRVSQAVSASPATTLTFSVSWKKGTRRWVWISVNSASNNSVQFFDLDTESLGTSSSTGSGITKVSASISPQGNGWFRCVFNVLSTYASVDAYTGMGTSDGTSSYVGTTSDYNWLWGASLVPANQSTLPYQRVNTATDYNTTGFLPFLRFDGVDDSLSTNSISFTSTDKMSVFAGVRKLSDAAVGMLYETGNNNTGAVFLAAPITTGVGDYRFRSAGSLSVDVNTGALYAAPRTDILTGLSDISGDLATLRINGSQVAQNTSNQGTGNFGNWPLYIGRRNNASLPFNGQMYSMIIVGKAVTAGELSSTETYVNQKTGAY